MPQKETKECAFSKNQKIIISDMMKKVKVNHIFSKQSTYLLKFIFAFKIKKLILIMQSLSKINDIKNQESINTKGGKRKIKHKI